MRKTTIRLLAFFMLASTLFALFAVTAQAQELPIDIDIIRRQHGPQGSAIANYFDIDIFNERSDRLSLALAEVNRLERQAMRNSLFVSVAEYEEEDIETQIMALAAENALFAQPQDFSGFAGFAEEDTIPLWIIILVIAGFSAGGLALAFGLRARKRRRADVH